MDGADKQRSEIRTRLAKSNRGGDVMHDELRSEAGRMALNYAEEGIPVFPLYRVAGGKCSCKRKDCRQPGKHPMTKHGFKEATTDLEAVRHWWREWPGANIGVPTGKESGWAVLDIDPRNGGAKSLEILAAEHGILPTTLSQRTGGGGHHFIYEYRESLKCRNGLLPGIDLKADGGYIVVPPSRHESGEIYQWEDYSLAPAPLPDFLLQLARRARRLTREPTVKSTQAGCSFREGSRNNSLTSLAGRMRRYGMQADEIEAALQVANSRRCQPPLEKSEVHRISQSVCRYQPSAECVFEQVPSTHWRMLDVADLPQWDCQPLVWLVKGIIAKGNLVLLAAPTQTGKTLFALYLAELLVRGGKLFGKYEVKPQSKVLYLALEDPDRRIRDRLLDIEKGFVDGSSPIGKGQFQVYLASGLALDDERCFAPLEELIGEEGFDFVFLDTYQKATPGLSSFLDEAQSKILHRLSDLTRKHFATLTVLDHLRKESGSKRRTKSTIDDIKGTGGKAQNADVVILLERWGKHQLAFRSFSKDADEPVEILLRVSKQGSGAEKFQYSDELTDGGGTGKGDQTKRKVLAVFKPGVSLSSSEVADKAKVSDSTSRRYLGKLAEEGRLIRTGDGCKTEYILADKPDNQSAKEMSG